MKLPTMTRCSIALVALAPISALGLFALPASAQNPAIIPSANVSPSIPVLTPGGSLTQQLQINSSSSTTGSVAPNTSNSSGLNCTISTDVTIPSLNDVLYVVTVACNKRLQLLVSARV